MVAWLVIRFHFVSFPLVTVSILYFAHLPLTNGGITRLFFSHLTICFDRFELLWIAPAVPHRWMARKVSEPCLLVWNLVGFVEASGQIRLTNVLVKIGFIRAYIGWDKPCVTCWRPIGIRILNWSRQWPVTIKRFSSRAKLPIYLRLALHLTDTSSYLQPWLWLSHCATLYNNFIISNA